MTFPLAGIGASILTSMLCCGSSFAQPYDFETEYRIEKGAPVVRTAFLDGCAVRVSEGKSLVDTIEATGNVPHARWTFTPHLGEKPRMFETGFYGGKVISAQFKDSPRCAHAVFGLPGTVVKETIEATLAEGVFKADPARFVGQESKWGRIGYVYRQSGDDPITVTVILLERSASQPTKWVGALVVAEK